MSIRHDISGLERVGRIGAASLGITSLSAARTTRQERQLPGMCFVKLMSAISSL